MKVLLDTNIVLHLLLNRKPWASSLASLVHATAGGVVEAWVAGTTLTNVFYVVRKLTGVERARAIPFACLGSFRIAAVDEAVLREALSFDGPDFEDDVQIAAARTAGLDGILTGDPRDFTASAVTVWDPHSFDAMLRRV